MVVGGGGGGGVVRWDGEVGWWVWLLLFVVVVVEWWSGEVGWCVGWWWCGRVVLAFQFIGESSEIISKLGISSVILDSVYIYIDNTVDVMVQKAFLEMFCDIVLEL